MWMFNMCVCVCVCDERQKVDIVDLTKFKQTNKQKTRRSP